MRMEQCYLWTSVLTPGGGSPPGSDPGDLSCSPTRTPSFSFRDSSSSPTQLSASGSSFGDLTKTPPWSTFGASSSFSPEFSPLFPTVMMASGSPPSSLPGSPPVSSPGTPTRVLTSSSSAGSSPGSPPGFSPASSPRSPTMEERHSWTTAFSPGTYRGGSVSSTPPLPGSPAFSFFPSSISSSSSSSSSSPIASPIFSSCSPSRPPSPGSEEERWTLVRSDHPTKITLRKPPQVTSSDSFPVRSPKISLSCRNGWQGPEPKWVKNLRLLMKRTKRVGSRLFK